MPVSHLFLIAAALRTLVVGASLAGNLDHERRQIMDTHAEEFNIRGRITGLKYLNPANAPDEWEFLARAGGGNAQGYLYAKPLPAGDLTDWLRQREDEA